MQCLCAAINALPAPTGIVLRRDAEALHGKMHLRIPALLGWHAPGLWPQRAANHQPLLGPRESNIEEPPMLLHFSLLAFQGSSLARSDLFRTAGGQDRKLARTRVVEGKGGSVRVVLGGGHVIDIT